jgi:protein required for attachment to host cells
MKQPRTYILIADGARARLVVSEGRGKALREVEGAEFEHKAPPTHQLGSDRPGRVQESANTARHAVEQTDWHRREEQLFAKRLAEMLARRLANGEFQRLVLVAAPETLGDLRPALSEKVRGTVMAEIAKDLTKIPNPEIRSHLPDDVLL